MAKIKRDVNGVVDFCLANVEAIDDNPDLDIEKKARLGLAYLKEARGYVMADLQNKRLTMQAPTVAKDKSIVLTVGTERPAIEHDAKDDAKETADAAAA